ncbi:MAG: hypothetical protein K2M31_02895 [Muribaculaceae bacterium]|nr:hypothetical protein [Muribaculaceae bacterium]
MDSNLIWQYAAVLILILFAIWRMIAGIRKRNKAMKKGGSCCGCSLASSCKDYKKQTGRSFRSDMRDKPVTREDSGSPSKSADHGNPPKNDCYQ